MGAKKKDENLVRGDLWYADPEYVVLVGIDTDDGQDHVLAPDPVNRQPLEDAAVNNVMTFGVLEPIWVRRVKVDATSSDTCLECIFGRTRVLLAREANKRLVAQGRGTIRVPCLIKNLEEKILVGAMLSENEMRRVTSPLEKARTLQRAYQRGVTPEEAVEIFGVVPASIERWEKLIALNPEVIKRVERGEINATAALALSDLPQALQVEALDSALEGATGGKTAGKKTASGAKVARAVAADLGVMGDGHKALTPRTLRQILRIDTQERALSPEASAVLRWIVFGEALEEIPGLARLLRLLADGVQKPVPGRKRGRPPKVR